MMVPVGIAAWDAAEDGWNPLTNPQPPLVERRAVPRCVCGSAHPLAVTA